MSTYTDLHTRTRENLTILRMPGNPMDGATPQRVIFCNEENVYRGTFKGKIDATDVKLTDTTLNNATINGGVISNAMIYSDERIISVAQLTADISQFKQNIADLQTSAEYAATSCNNLDLSVSQLSTASYQMIDQLSTIISGMINDGAGLNYQGNLLIDNHSLVDGGKISALIHANYAELPLSTQLKDGFFYVVKTEDKSIHYTVEDVALTYGDWLIVSKDTSISGITSADVKVIDIVDYDMNYDVFILSSNNTVQGNNAFIGCNTFTNNTRFASVDISSSASISSASISALNTTGMSASSISVELENMRYNNGLCSLNALTDSIQHEITYTQSSVSGLSGNVAKKSTVSVDNAQSDLNVVHMSYDEYAQVLSGDVPANTLYILSGQTIDAYGKKITGVLSSEDPTDAATYGQVLEVKQTINSLSTYSDIATKLSTDGYVTSSQTSSATELETKFNSLSTYSDISAQLSNDGYVMSSQISSKLEQIDHKILIDDRIDGISAYGDLNVVKLSVNEYATMLSDGADLSNGLYVVENDVIDAYGQQIKNVAYPTDLSDATPKMYVDNIVNLLKDALSVSEISQKAAADDIQLSNVTCCLFYLNSAIASLT